MDVVTDTYLDRCINELEATAVDAIKALQHQLHAARYAFHKVRCKVYGDAVMAGKMPPEQAQEMYRLAMLNYDELIKSAAGGALTKADEADMVRGFPL